MSQQETGIRGIYVVIPGYGQSSPLANNHAGWLGTTRIAGGKLPYRHIGPIHQIHRLLTERELIAYCHRAGDIGRAAAFQRQAGKRGCPQTQIPGSLFHQRAIAGDSSNLRCCTGRMGQFQRCSVQRQRICLQRSGGAERTSADAHALCLQHGLLGRKGECAAERHSGRSRQHPGIFKTNLASSADRSRFQHQAATTLGRNVSGKGGLTDGCHCICDAQIAVERGPIRQGEMAGFLYVDIRGEGIAAHRQRGPVHYHSLVECIATAIAEPHVSPHADHQRLAAEGACPGQFVGGFLHTNGSDCQ